MNTTILITEGKPEMHDFDKNYYTDDHDVPVLWIGGQVIAIGNGHKQAGFGFDAKNPLHLRWKLDPNRIYRVTIEEVVS